MSKVQSLRSLTVKLNSYGAAEQISRPFKLYQGSYGFVNLQCLVPITQNTTQASVCYVYRVCLNDKGDEVAQANYNMIYVGKTELEGYEYSLFECPMPKEFTSAVGSLKLVFNYCDVENDKIVSILTTGTYETEVFKGGFNNAPLEMDLTSQESAQITKNTRDIEQLKQDMEDFLQPPDCTEADNVGTPNVELTISGNLKFSNLKGETGEKGDRGDKGYDGLACGKMIFWDTYPQRTLNTSLSIFNRAPFVNEYFTAVLMVATDVVTDFESRFRIATCQATDIINNQVTVRVIEDGRLDGPKGEQGVGITTVTPNGTDASGGNIYKITLTNGEAYNFIAPKGATGDTGEKGDEGKAATLEISSIEMLDEYEEPEVVNLGTENAANYALKVPRGHTGKGFYVAKTYESVQAMNDAFATDGLKEGEFVIITSDVEDEDNAKLYVKGKTSYTFLTDMSGASGINGRGINGTSISYAVSDSATEIPTEWTPNLPYVENGKRLWTRTVLNYTDNTQSTSYSVAYQGVDGDDDAFVKKAGDVMTGSLSTSGTLTGENGVFDNGSRVYSVHNPIPWLKTTDNNVVATVEPNTGGFSIAIGANAKVDANDAVVIGANAHTNNNAASQSIAIGYSSVGTNVYSVAIGSRANSNGPGAIAIGADANARNFESIAIGHGANIYANNAIAIGYMSYVNGAGISIGTSARTNGGVAIGQGAVGHNYTGKGNFTTAIGYSVTACGDNSVAIGSNAQDYALNSIAIGKTIYISENYPIGTANSGLMNFATNNAIAIGSSVTVSGGSLVAIGDGISIPSYQDNTDYGASINIVAIGRNISVNKASGSTAIGSALRINAVGTIAIGDYITIPHSHPNTGKNIQSSISIGGYSHAASNQAIAIGYMANTIQSNAAGLILDAARAIAIGSFAESYNAASIAIGNTAKSYGSNSIAIGQCAKTYYNSSVVIGNNAHDSGVGDGVVAIGNNAHGSGASFIAIGQNSSVPSAYTIAIGMGAVGSGIASIAIGRGVVSAGLNSIAIGNNAYTSPTYPISSSASSVSHNAIAIGRNSTATASNTISLGTSSKVLSFQYSNGIWGSAVNSIAIGTYACVNASLNCIAIGATATIGHMAPNAIAIGTSAVSSYTGSIAIGNSALATAPSQFVLGGSGITSLRCAVQTITSLSDERTKEEIELANTARCLEDVEKLPVKRFKFKDWAKQNPIDVHRTGFIAQDVERVFPKDVEIDPSYFPVLDENNNPVMEDDIDENGNPVMEDEIDEEGNPVMEDEIDEDGNLVYEAVRDEENNIVMEDVTDFDGNPVYETVTINVLNEENNPVYQDITDELGNVIGREIQTTTEQRVKKKPKLRVKQRIKQRIKQREKQFVIEDCKKISMHDGLPTLWGAVQYLAQRVRELENKLSEVK